MSYRASCRWSEQHEYCARREGRSCCPLVAGRRVRIPTEKSGNSGGGEWEQFRRSRVGTIPAEQRGNSGGGDSGKSGGAALTLSSSPGGRGLLSGRTRTYLSPRPPGEDERGVSPRPPGKEGWSWCSTKTVGQTVEEEQSFPTEHQGGSVARGDSPDALLKEEGHSIKEEGHLHSLLRREERAGVLSPG